MISDFSDIVLNSRKLHSHLNSIEFMRRLESLRIVLLLAMCNLFMSTSMYSDINPISFPYKSKCAKLCFKSSNL